MRILTYAIVIVSSFVFSGVCSEDELLMDPSKSPYTVVEGTDVKLTCYTRDREGIIRAMWKIGDTFVAKTTVNNSGNCRLVYAPTNIYRSETTTASCNRTSSSIKIEKVTNADAKNWSCSSGGFHAHVLLKMDTRKENTPLPPVLVTSPQTTDVSRESQNSSHSTYLLTSPPTTDVSRESENTSHSTYLLTSPPTTDVPRESENASTTFQQSDMDVDYNLVMICAGSAGGILAFVLLLVGLLKVVASVRDHVSKRERTRAYSTSSLAEMAEDVADLYSKVQKPCIKGVNRTARNDDILLGGRMVKELTTIENPVYWTAGNMTASEARDETSVADGGNGNDDVADLYSKVQKPCIKGVNRTARNDDILLGGRMVKELTTTDDVADLYSKVQKPCIKGVNRTARNDDILLGGRMVKELTTTVELSELYAKVQKSDGGEAEGRASTDNNVPFGGWVPEEQSRDVNTVETIYSKVQRSEVKPKTEPDSGDICANPEKRKEIPSDKLEEQS